MLSYADYQNTSHASSLQLPTYPISYYGQCEEGDELAARLAEDGTHYLSLVEAESPFQHCERHRALLHLHQQLHPLPNSYAIILYLPITITSGIGYVTTKTIIENTVLLFRRVPFLLSDPVGHSDPHVFLDAVNVGAEGGSLPPPPHPAAPSCIHHHYHWIWWWCCGRWWSSWQREFALLNFLHSFSFPSFFPLHSLPFFSPLCSTPSTNLSIYFPWFLDFLEFISPFFLKRGVLYFLLIPALWGVFWVLPKYLDAHFYFIFAFFQHFLALF